MQEDSVISYVINEVSYSIRSNELKLMDSVLLPEPNEDIEISE